MSSGDLEELYVGNEQRYNLFNVNFVICETIKVATGTV